MTTAKKTKSKSKRKGKSKWEKLSEARIKERQKKKKENQAKFLQKVAKRKGYEHLKIIRWTTSEKNKKDFSNEAVICCEPEPEHLFKILESREMASFAGMDGFFFEPYELGDLLADLGDTDFGDPSRGKNEDEVYCDDCKCAILLTQEYLDKVKPKKKKSTKSKN